MNPFALWYVALDSSVIDEHLLTSSFVGSIQVYCG